MALEQITPLTLMSGRYLTSGAILLVASVAARAYIPKGRELLRIALTGILLLGGGNAALTFAELWIPSGLAALFLTTSPFWMLGFDAMLPGGERLHWPTLAGVAVGFLGVFLLIAPALTGATLDWDTIRGFLTLQAGCLCWTLGALLQRRHHTKAHPIVSGAVQQFASGFAYLIPALLIRPQTFTWSGRSFYAFLWLIVFGAIVGYSSYAYALAKLPVAISSTYTYVNPLVAVLLGRIFYDEPLGWRQLVAMVAIFAGVAMVQIFTPIRKLPAAVGRPSYSR